MTYLELEKDSKYKRGQMGCCKKDCKSKECFKNKMCIDFFIHNNLLHLLNEKE